MLKPIVLAFASVLAVSFALPEAADAQQQRSVRIKKERKVARHADRDGSVDRNGLCLRDSGKPDDKLDFRKRCDVEEFWNRINERASSSSPM